MDELVGLLASMGLVPSTCGARTRSGTPCRRRDLYASGRCKLHGGLSTGPKTSDGKARSAANGRRQTTSEAHETLIKPNSEQYARARSAEPAGEAHEMLANVQVHTANSARTRTREDVAIGPGQGWPYGKPVEPGHVPRWLPGSAIMD